MENKLLPVCVGGGSIRQKAEGSKRSALCEKGLQVTWQVIAHCSFPGSVPEFSDTDDACLKIIGPSVSLQMPGENPKCSNRGQYGRLTIANAQVMVLCPCVEALGAPFKSGGSHKLGKFNVRTDTLGIFEALS